MHEYLRTRYRPDLDYVDGSLIDRGFGDQRHGLVQVAISAIFTMHRHVWHLRAALGLRLQVAPMRVRVADVCLIPSPEPIVPVPSKPPLLCIEVLSPDDRLQRMITRCQDYLAMGVPHVWIIDAETRECWTLTSAGGAVPMLDDAFTLPGTPVRVALADIFEEIDAAPSA